MEHFSTLQGRLERRETRLNPGDLFEFTSPDIVITNRKEWWYTEDKETMRMIRTLNMGDLVVLLETNFTEGDGYCKLLTRLGVGWVQESTLQNYTKAI